MLLPMLIYDKYFNKVILQLLLPAFFLLFHLVIPEPKGETLSHYQEDYTTHLYRPGQCLCGHASSEPIFFFA